MTFFLFQAPVTFRASDFKCFLGDAETKLNKRKEILKEKKDKYWRKNKLKKCLKIATQLLHTKKTLLSLAELEIDMLEQITRKKKPVKEKEPLDVNTYKSRTQKMLEIAMQIEEKEEKAEEEEKGHSKKVRFNEKVLRHYACDELSLKGYEELKK